MFYCAHCQKWKKIKDPNYKGKHASCTACAERVARVMAIPETTRERKRASNAIHNAANDYH